MKILFKGLESRPPVKTLFRLTCDHCHSIFEAKASEMRAIHENGESLGDGVDCPVCLTLVFNTVENRVTTEERLAKMLG